MTYLLLLPYNASTKKRLEAWRKSIRRNLQKYFIKRLGPAYMFEANGEILALAWALKKRSGDNLEIYVMDNLITEMDIPEEVLTYAKKLIEKPTLRKETEELKKLRRLKLWITKMWEER